MVEDAFKDKIKTVGSLLRKGQKNVTPVVGDHGGRVGEQIEHWDGRVDAVARPTTVQVKAGLKNNDSEE